MLQVIAALPRTRLGRFGGRERVGLEESSKLGSERKRKRHQSKLFKVSCAALDVRDRRHGRAREARQIHKAQAEATSPRPDPCPDFFLPMQGIQLATSCHSFFIIQDKQEAIRTISRLFYRIG